MRVPVVAAIGVDITKILRFERLLSKPKPFVNKLYGRILHPQERQSVATARSLAGAWAVKEAVFKTLTDDEQRRFQFNQWYRVYDELGRPSVAHADFGVDEFMVLLSHDDDLLVATVLRQKWIDIK
ncbi:4'-phosphopantetheinyl transferase superfamily protein [Kocuria palustris]|nr:4'-phosphopantetheinyl transferase superfamily protein [Kocuria palustris]